jgi:hypothetical protein
MTLFYAVNANFPVSTVRIDTDNLPVKGGLCP